MSERGRDDYHAQREKAKRHRINHVGTKLNEAELKAFEALCERREQTPSELIRTLIQRELRNEEKSAVPSPELVQIEAIRLYLINLFKLLLVNGEQLPEKTWTDYIDKIATQKYTSSEKMLETYRQKNSLSKS